jgi:DNA modification methylase
MFDIYDLAWDTYATPSSVVVNADCLAALRGTPSGTVQTCVTSPPYFGLRDYGVDGQLGLEPTPEQYVAAMVAVFREVRRVLTADGTLWLNIGDSYVGAMSQHKDSGSFGETSCISKKTKSGIPQTGRVERNRLLRENGLKQKDLIGIPWMLAFALRADGWYLRQDIIWHKPNPMPESVRDRCTKAHEYIFLLSKSERYYFDSEAIKEPCKQDWGTRDRKNGKYHNDGTGLQPHGGLEKSYTMANKRSVWTVATRPYKGAHFATFPPALIEPCILAGSRPGDVVLDPFNGSGTTGQVALTHGRKYLGCELNPDYVELTRTRLDAFAHAKINTAIV